jgi:hypothetical protein
MSFAWKQNRRNARRKHGVNYMSRKQRKAFKYQDKKSSQQAGLNPTKGDHR